MATLDRMEDAILEDALELPERRELVDEAFDRSSSKRRSTDFDSLIASPKNGKTIIL